MAESHRDTPWQWKVGTPAHNERLRMLYEPGNWGDIVKGVWMVAAAGAVARAASGRTVRYLDPFAGAPTYPLTEGAARRIAGMAGSDLARVAGPHLARQEWPSSALLFRDACAASGRTAQLHVFDLDRTRRTEWSSVGKATVCPGSDGEGILDAARSGEEPFDFVLVDPYDFLADWTRLLPPVLALARRSCVLCYLYNRGPRSVGHLNLYKRFRKELDLRRAGRPFLLGRLACDEVLPRAYHELLLLGPDEVLAPVRAPLRERTQALARRLAEAQAFEAGT